MPISSMKGTVIPAAMYSGALNKNTNASTTHDPRACMSPRNGSTTASASVFGPAPSFAGVGASSVAPIPTLIAPAMSR